MKNKQYTKEEIEKLVKIPIVYAKWKDENGVWWEGYSSNGELLYAAKLEKEWKRNI